MFGNAYDERNQYRQFAFFFFFIASSNGKRPGVLRYGCRKIMDRRENFDMEAPSLRLNNVLGGGFWFALV